MSTRSILALGLAVGPAVSLRRILDKERFETAVEEDAYGAKGKVIETVAKRSKNHSGLAKASSGKGCFQYTAKDKDGSEYSYGLEMIEENSGHKVDDKQADLNLEFTYCTLKKDTRFMFADQVKAAKPRGGKVGKTVGNSEIKPDTNYWWVGSPDSAKTSGFFYYDFVTNPANGGAATEDVVGTLYPGTDGKGCEVLGLTNKGQHHTSYATFGIVADCEGDVKSLESAITAEGLGSGVYTYECTGTASASADRRVARRVEKYNNPLGNNDEALKTVIARATAKPAKELPADTTGQGCFNIRVNDLNDPAKKAYQYGLALIDKQDGVNKGDFMLNGYWCEKKPGGSFSDYENMVSARPANPAVLKPGLATKVKAGTPYWFVGKPSGVAGAWGYFYYQTEDADESDYALVLGATTPGDSCTSLGLTAVADPVEDRPTAIVNQCAQGISSPMKGGEIGKLDVDATMKTVVGEGKYWYEVPSAMLDTNGVPIEEPEDEVPVAEILNHAQSAEQFAEFLEEELHEAGKEYNDSDKQMADKIWTLHHAANLAHEDYNGAVLAIEEKNGASLSAMAELSLQTSFLQPAGAKPADHVAKDSMNGRALKTYEEATKALASFAANKYPADMDMQAPESKELQRQFRVLADAKARYVAAEAALTAAIQELHDSVNAEAAPEAVSTSKPWYKRWWFYLLLVIVIIGVVAGGVYCFLTCGESTEEAEA